MGKSSELLKNTAIISIGKMGTQVVNFLLLPLYTAKLTTEAYGNFDYVTTIAFFLVPLMTLLMEESMFRFLIDSKTDKEKKTIISHTFLFCLFYLNSSVLNLAAVTLALVVSLIFNMHTISIFLNKFKRSNVIIKFLPMRYMEIFLWIDQIYSLPRQLQFIQAAQTAHQKQALIC